MQIIDGRRYETRAELAARHGVSARTLGRLWQERATNGHPPAVPVGRTLHWDTTEFDTWFATVQPEAGRTEPQRPAVPEGLAGPAEFARICGHADTSTISHWIKHPPSGWPEPDHWETLPSGRRRPYWQPARMQAFAATDRSARPAAGRPAKPYRYAGDERLTRARTLLAQQPEARTAQAVEQLQQHDPTGTSGRVWTEIVRTARKHPEE